jgi:hypothetical protein
VDVDAYRPLIAALVDAGYAVVRVNYRGSTGYGRTWRDALVARLGAIEMEDIAAVRASLEADGVIDPDKVAIVVALVPLADFAMSQEDQPAFMTAYDHVLFGGTLEEMPDEYRAASPLTYVDDVRSPVLITAGANDPAARPGPPTPTSSDCVSATTTWSTSARTPGTRRTTTSGWCTRSVSCSSSSNRVFLRVERPDDQRGGGLLKSTAVRSDREVCA